MLTMMLTFYNFYILEFWFYMQEGQTLRQRKILSSLLRDVSRFKTVRCSLSTRSCLFSWLGMCVWQMQKDCPTRTVGCSLYCRSTMQPRTLLCSYSWRVVMQNDVTRKRHLFCIRRWNSVPHKPCMPMRWGIRLQESETSQKEKVRIKDC